MKLSKKLLALVMVFVCALSVSFGACSGGQEPDSETDLTISFWKAGWGDQYIKNTIADFEIAYPQYNVDLQSSTNGFMFAETIDHGAEMNNIDLYIGSFMQTPYNEHTEPLNDLLNRKCYGENITLGEKLGQFYCDGLTHRDGNIYGLPESSGGYVGLVYNADMIGEGTDYDIPVTTDELELLVLDLLDDNNLTNVYPFIHYGQGDYWQRVYQQWWIQYDGIDAYYDFIALKDADGNSPSKNVITAQDGRWASISVLESIVSKDTVYPGSNQLDYQQAQTYFMNGASVMMANGNWLINEMKSNKEASASNLKLMRTPVISALALPDENGYDRLPSVEDDRELAAVIRKMDEDVAYGRGGALTGDGFDITREDYDRIYEARFVGAPGCDASLMVIPDYSTAKDAAKDFLLFVFSDEQLKKKSQLLHADCSFSGSNFTLDTTGWLDFEISAMELGKHTTPVLGEAVGIKSNLFTLGGLAIWYTSPIREFCQQESLTKEQYWNKLIDYYERNWDAAVRNAAAALEG